jgi:ABC-type uncharacterized transport system auxiliary subunit
VQLNEFYADYRDNTDPKAVISLRFILTKPNGSVVLDKIFTQKITLSAKNTASLLATWNTAVQTILTNAIRTLNRCTK